LYGYRIGEVRLPLINAVKEDLRIRLRDSRVSRRPVSESLGCHVKGVAPPHPDHDDPINYAGAAFKRVGAVLPDRKTQIYHELIVFTNKLLRKWKSKYGLRRLESKDYTVEDWLRNSNYSETRKAQLLEISKKPYDPKKHNVVKMFIKDEFYETDDKYPRLIMSRHDRFKCRVGPMFQRIEKALFALPMFIKKIPVEQRGEYIRQYLYKPGCSYFATDFSSYETHFTTCLMLSIEFQLYKFLVPHDKEGRQFMKDIGTLLGRNHCTNKLADIWINGVRMSGEMNTSLGNGFSNYVLMKFAAFKSGTRVKGVVEGDDGCFRTRKTIDPAIFKELGLNVKFVEYPTIGEMSFCGILQDEIGRQTITDPFKVLARFGWSNRKYVGSAEKTKRSLAVAKALSYAHAYPHMPIVRPFCDMILRLCDLNKYRVLRVINSLDCYQRDRFIDAFNRRNEIPKFAPTMETRALVSKLFGISPEKQIKLENQFLKVKKYGPLELDLDFGRCYTLNFQRYATYAEGFSRIIVDHASRDRVLDLVQDLSK
jgi:hypothetical protein